MVGFFVCTCGVCLAHRYCAVNVNVYVYFFPCYPTGTVASFSRFPWLSAS